MRKSKSGLGLLSPIKKRRRKERKRRRKRERIKRREKRIMRREKRIIRRERRRRAWVCACMGVSCANLGFKC